MHPFGDERQRFISICTIDFDQDLIAFSDESGHIQLPLARLREPDSEPPQRSEFRSFEIASPPTLDLLAFSPPYQKLTTFIPQRRLAFASRILTDFAHQWRHILRSSYADSTFRRLAKAVISIATNSFHTQELSTRMQVDYYDRRPQVLKLPTWAPYESQSFTVGRTKVILNQDLRTALEIVKKKVEEIGKPLNTSNCTEQRTYLLLSMRHILVCHVDAAGNFSHTAPKAFMDGITPPSISAIELFLQVLLPSRLPPHTPVHNLPLEIQDRILYHVSAGPIEAARLGCILGIGSPFTWRRAVDWPRHGGPIEMKSNPTHRNEYSPVESRIYFEGVFSEICYQ